MEKSSLASLIEKIRTDAGDSPAKAAGKVGVSRQGYLKWETGDTANMKLGNLLAFCDKYNVDVGLLLRGMIVVADECHQANTQPNIDNTPFNGEPRVAYSATPVVTELSAREPDPNIRKLIEAYHVADSKDREQMIWLADRALAAFEKRSEQNE